MSAGHIVKWDIRATPRQRDRFVVVADECVSALGICRHSRFPLDEFDECYVWVPLLDVQLLLHQLGGGRSLRLTSDGGGVSPQALDSCARRGGGSTFCKSREATDNPVCLVQ